MNDFEAQLVAAMIAYANGGTPEEAKQAAYAASAHSEGAAIAACVTGPEGTAIVGVFSAYELRAGRTVYEDAGLGFEAHVELTELARRFA